MKGPFQQARDLNIQTLLQYDVDRLLAGYRKEAWLPARATQLSQLAGLDGHVGGMNEVVRYRGAESGNRRFDIYIDDTKLASENTSDKGNKNEFRNVEYAIPDSLVKGKSFVRVKFQAYKQSIA